MLVVSLWGADPEYSVTDRGAHHRVFERFIERSVPGGGSFTERQTYTELNSGICYWDPLQGQWLDSQDLIEPVQDGATAVHGPYQVHFQSNLRTRGAIRITLPEGGVLNSHVIGLVYTDLATRQSVLFAETKDCAGVILPPNSVLYEDAFSDVRASVRYTYQHGLFSQFVIFHENLPAPAAFGMSEETTILQVFTEFVDSVEPARTAHQFQFPKPAGQPKAPALSAPDETLVFGAMRMGRGRAYMLGQERNRRFAPVVKTWERRDGRVCLVESSAYTSVQGDLARLPQAAGIPRRLEKVRRLAGGPGLLPPMPGWPKAARQPMLRLAALPPPREGLTWDYELNGGGYTNYVFLANGNYYISGYVSLHGSTVFSGGSVLKMTPAGGGLTLYDNVRVNPDPYLPTLITARDDDSVGIVLPDSIHTPLPGCYGAPALELSEGLTASNYLGNMRFLYSDTALQADSDLSFPIRHCQFSGCNAALATFFGGNFMVTAQNVLISDGGTCFFGGTLQVQHATLDNNYALADGDPGALTVNLTNSIVCRTPATNANLVLHADHVAFATTNSNVFEMSHYLPRGSTNVGAGTTSPPADLRAELAQRTTQAPQWLTGAQTTDVILQPGLALDTNAVDLGYHYAPLGYVAENWSLAPGVTALLTNGTALGISFSTSNGYDWGIILDDAKFISEATVDRSNYVVRSHMVQDLMRGNPDSRAMFYDGFADGLSTNRQSEARFRFTETTQFCNDGYFLYTGAGFRALEWSHCTLADPWIVGSFTGSNGPVVGLTNCLSLHGGYVLTAASTTRAPLSLQNNLFRDAYVSLESGTNAWSVRDNLLERTEFYANAATVGLSNAVFASTNVPWTNLTLTTLVYQTGTLGTNYLGGNAQLVNGGSITADLVGLYHFTTFTNNLKEANSVVDIGLHAVAMSPTGQALDCDGDGIYDYLEDRNGNGKLDPDLFETDWRTYTTIRNRVTGLQVFTPLK